MTDVYYQERTYAFDLEVVGSMSQNDLIVEFMPAEPGWEFYSLVGHPNFNIQRVGNKKLLRITYRKYGN